MRLSGASADDHRDSLDPWHRHHVALSTSAYLSGLRELKKRKSHLAFPPASPSTRMPLLNVLHTARAFPLNNDMNTVVIGPGEELGSPEFWWKMLTSTFLVLLGGVLSGYVPSKRRKTRH